jgi:hypothetical protein
MHDYEEHLQTLVDMETNALRRFGHLVLDEEQFYVHTTKLKKSLAPLFKQSVGLQLQHMTTAPHSPEVPEVGIPRSLIETIEKLEEVAEKGPAHIFGKVLVNPTNYSRRLQNVKTALAQAASEAENPHSSLDT